MFSETNNIFWICLPCIGGFLLLLLIYAVLDFIMRLFFKDYPHEESDLERQEREWGRYADQIGREMEREQEWQDYLERLRGE